MSHPLSRLGLLLAALVVVALGGCGPMTRYTDGSLSEYVKQPIPEPPQPIARTMSLEVIDFYAPGGGRPTMIGDSTGQQLVGMSGRVGRAMTEAIEIEGPLREAAVLLAFQEALQGRGKSRGPGSMPDTQSVAGDSADYIARQESLASEAYANKDYLKGDIHTSAAMNRIAIDSSFARAEATLGVTMAAMGALQAVGKALIEQEYRRVREWTLNQSGAVGESAPEGTHLSVYILQYLDGRSFRTDSHQRLGVYLALTRADGTIVEVVETSDLFFCTKECNLFPLSGTAVPFEADKQSPMVRDLYFAADGLNYLNANGFDWVSGMYTYLLLKHGIDRLAKEAGPSDVPAGDP